MHRQRNTKARIIVGAALAVIVGASLLADDRPARAQDGLVVVVNAHNRVQSLSRSDVRNIFLGRTKFWSNGRAVKPYPRPPSTAAGRGLFRALGMAPARYRHHWQTLQLSGRGTAPRELASPGRAAAYVAADPGAVTVMTVTEARHLPSSLRALPLR